LIEGLGTSIVSLDKIPANTLRTDSKSGGGGLQATTPQTEANQSSNFCKVDFTLHYALSV